MSQVMEKNRRFNFFYGHATSNNFIQTKLRRFYVLADPWEVKNSSRDRQQTSKSSIVVNSFCTKFNVPIAMCYSAERGND